MPKVLTAASTVLCGQDTGTNHGGTVVKQAATKLAAGGQGVLLAAGVAGKTVTAGSCKTPVSSSTSKCTTVATVAQGEATKLTVAGKGVLLEGLLVGTTDGVPPGTLAGTGGNQKLTAV